MTAPGCGLVLECTLGPNPLSTSFIFLEQVWTSDWNKFFLILSHLGYYYNQKSNVRKTWNYLRLSWDVRKRKKIPVMIWEIWFSPNNLPDLTPLLLPPKYTFWWVSELCLLLQVYKYMAKLIIQKKKDIEERNKDKRPHFIISSRHHCVNHFILSEPQSLQNGTFDHRQCWQPKGVK